MYKDLSQKRKDQIKAGVKKRRQKIKKQLIEAFGGECSLCGYNKCVAALEFHHTDPTKKELKIATSSRCFESIMEEAEKCILVCSNCHREIHHQDSY